MLPVLVFQTAAFVLNLIIALFLIYYLLSMRKKVKELEKKENKIDSDFHHVVDDAMSRERKILEDATSEAGHILNDAKYINQTSKQTVDQALAKMLEEVRHETNEAAKEVRNRYITGIEQLANTSMHDFQTVSQQLKLDLSAQLKTFHETLLPSMEKEVEAYKQQRFKQAEASIGKIVQQAAQDMFSKSISLEEHQKLLVDALEKAKKDNLFG